MGVLIREKDDADPSASDDGDLEDDIINDKTQVGTGRGRPPKRKIVFFCERCGSPEPKSGKRPNQNSGKKARMENYQR